VSKRKKTNGATPADLHGAEQPGVETEAQESADESVTTRAAAPAEVMEVARARGRRSRRGSKESEVPPETDAPTEAEVTPPEVGGEPSELGDVEISDLDVPPSFDSETTVNLVGEIPMPGRDDLDEPTVSGAGDMAGAIEEVDRAVLQRRHLRGLLEALVFASDSPIKTHELAKLASAPAKLAKELLAELKQDFSGRGIHLDEVAGGWVMRTSPQYAPFIRDLTKQKPVRLTRAQVETLAIISYRQPITRPEIDDVRGVDSGPVLKLLLERDLVRILGKRDEPGRPLIYGTTGHFLEFFGLKSLKDLPTLREFTELTDESRATYENELGEPPDPGAAAATIADGVAIEGDGVAALEGDLPAVEDGADDADGADGDDATAQRRAPQESMRVPAMHEDGEGDDPYLDGAVDGGDDDDHPSDHDGPTLPEVPRAAGSAPSPDLDDAPHPGSTNDDETDDDETVEH